MQRCQSDLWSLGTNWTFSNNEGAQSPEQAESYRVGEVLLPTLTEDSSEGTTQSVEVQEGTLVEGMPTVTQDNALTENSIEVLVLALQPAPPVVRNIVQDDNSVQVSSHPLQVVRRVLKANASSDTVKVSNASKEQDDDFVCEIDETGTKQVCPPQAARHKTEILEEQISSTKPGMERRNAVIRSLQEMRVRVYIIEGKSIRNTKEILDHIRRVVGFVARENRIHEKTGPLGYQRCLLYQDPDGRLFNLTLAKHAVGPASRWEEYLDSFSGKEAMIALTVLCRSFPCATEGMHYTYCIDRDVPVGFAQF
jgi:hypothetical protein